MNTITSTSSQIREMDAEELLAIFERDKAEYDYNMAQLNKEDNSNEHDCNCYYIYAPNVRLIERELKPIIENYRQLTGITLQL